MSKDTGISGNVSTQCLRKRSSFFLWPIVLSCVGAVALLLGQVLLETIGFAAPFLFSASVYLLLVAQKEKLQRSTIFVLWAIITAFLGVLFLELGIHVKEWLGDTTLIYPFIAFLLSLFAFAHILITGEILKLSGIAKILLLLVAAWLFGRLGVLELEMLRKESQNMNSVQVQSPSTLCNEDQNNANKN